MLSGLINTGQLGLPGRNTSRRTTLNLTGLIGTALDLSKNLSDILLNNQVVATYNRPQLKLEGYETGVSMWANDRLGMISNGTGVAVFRSTTDIGMMLKSTLPVCWSNADINGGADLFLYRDSSASLGQRNGTTAQASWLYNTYTSATNFERGVFDWITTANTLRIGTEKGSGGGTARDLVLVTDGTTRLTIGATTGIVTLTAPVTIKGYTVATLPAGVQGHKAFVTDALAPTYLTAVVGGGAVVTEVFYNGTAYVCT